ncbi:MAG: PKD domain-containing protein [Ferruginibacter sp.]
MKKQYIIIFLLVLSSLDSLATHTKGGWMYYEYLGPGLLDPSKLRYKIGLKFYIDCNSSLIDNPINFSIYQGRFPFNFIQDVSVSLSTISNSQNCTSASCYPCISFIPLICYQIITYETIVELDNTSTGFIISKQRCCRINNISNIDPPSNAVGATYSIKIPGAASQIPTSHINTSPKFIFNDTAIVCGNNFFSLNFGATDEDGDSLSYSFCDAYTGASNLDPAPNTASPPPYSFIPYLFPFSGTQPLGSLVTINPSTGITSGIAPAPGEYVVCICVKEFRNGIYFADSRKELHLKVASCNPVRATLDPTYLTCGDLTLSFSNQTDNPSITKWLWTFGDPSTGILDTSNLQTPSHTFSAAGVYTVKLVVNKGLGCTDSTVQQVSVFPGFFPGFKSNAPYCVGRPVQFNDTTRTNYGTVSNWSWNFGDLSTLADSSHLQNPTYTYNTPGTYTVKLKVGNSKGCLDSLTHSIVINDKPALVAAPSDSSYCALDSINLRALGTGSFAWLPATNIIGANTANPLVFPTSSTKYYVTLTAATGCSSRDSVRVNPINDLTNNIVANPTSICQEDSVVLTGSSNHTGVSWQWTPAATLRTPGQAQTIAVPNVTTTYTLRTQWGNYCIINKSVTIPVTPLAIPNAGADKNFCLAQDSVQLNASGGLTYTWTPVTGLSNPNIANPKAAPAVTTKYIVFVGVDGCSKTKADTVEVFVKAKPTLAMSPDTLICIIDTLQIFANGTGSVLWQPNYMINNVTSPSPLVSPDVPTTYKVRLTDNFGCFSDDSVFVDVKPFVSVNAGPDSSICKTEGYTLRASGDALRWSWSPATGLNNSLVKNPFARPLVTTTYTVIGNIGKCQSSSQVTIKVGPFPPANAGRDTLLCIGFDAQLLASGGSSYLWTPATFLNDRSIANPTVIKPTASIKYIVAVTDTLGCTRVIRDTVIVTVIPRFTVNAGPQDTSVVETEPLLLSVSGATTYLWTPGTWLSSTTSRTPVALPRNDITYYVTGTDTHGCQASDSIRVHLYLFDPDMLVPSAFTPNGDNNNDVARPILIGMKSLTYFRVYNRFGELMFATSEIGKGWNGNYKGKAQDAATFVWYAEGVTYKGEVKKKKGYVILIR